MLQMPFNIFDGRFYKDYQMLWVKGNVFKYVFISPALKNKIACIFGLVVFKLCYI